MQETFEFASGSVQGRDHRVAGRNNQDAVLLRHSDHATIGIIADGCGSSKYSEVGASVTSLILAGKIEDDIDYIPAECLEDSDLAIDPVGFWEERRQETLSGLEQLSDSWIGPWEGAWQRVMVDYLLCTTLAVIVTPTFTSFATIGDGALIINGTPVPLGPFPNNEPPYLAYGMFKPRQNATKETRFNVVTVSNDGLNHFLIGTDGALDLMRNADRKIPSPNKTEMVGPISQFWTEDRYFKNGDALRRRLTLINRDVIHPDWEQRTLNTEYGLLPDDTTMIVGRRRKVA